jgi:hypothetical protein
MAPSRPSNKKPKPPTGSIEAGKYENPFKAQGRIAELIACLTEKIFPLIPQSQRLTAFIVSIVALVFVALSIGFFFSGNAHLAFWLIVVAMVSSILIIVVLSRPLTWAGREARALEPWSRLLLKLPMPVDKVDELRNYLENVQQAAFAWLKGRRSDVSLQLNEIRANIFLADYGKADSRAPFVLFIPDRLRIGMNDHPDKDIRFRPGQGLTGRAFIEPDRKFAKTSETTPGHHIFDEVYELTDEQKRMVHPDLRWIVSFPLNVLDGVKRKPVGVLNVDGLKHQYTDDDLNLLWGNLSPQVQTITDALMGLPTVRIKIVVED